LLLRALGIGYIAGRRNEPGKLCVGDLCPIHPEAGGFNLPDWRFTRFLFIAHLECATWDPNHLGRSVDALSKVTLVRLAIVLTRGTT